MQIYLPIAETSVNIFTIFGMGTAVGFLSGMFGVGGGFLITPLLILSGIPAAVAVATGANQVVASSVSGTITQWRRGNVDFKMGTVLLIGGIFGAFIGVQIVKLLEATGQIEIVISLLFTVFLGGVGLLMLGESLRFIHKARSGKVASARMSGQHSWVHGLPFKIRFQRSKLYISAIPPLVIGVAVGLLSGILGVGGGFVMVPAMIYLLKMPTKVVIGTSLFQVIFVAGVTTDLSCRRQLRSRPPARIHSHGWRGHRRAVRRERRPEAARRALARTSCSSRAGRVAPPGVRSVRDAAREIFSRYRDREASTVMSRRVLRWKVVLLSLPILAAAALSLAPLPARAQGESVELDTSTREVSIEPDFNGAEIVIFGAVDNSQQPSATSGYYDIIIVIRGPAETIVTRRKERVAGVWINGRREDISESAEFFRRALDQTDYRYRQHRHARAL